MASLLVVVLVLVLDFPRLSEDENENDDDPKTRVSGQTLFLNLDGIGQVHSAGRHGVPRLSSWPFRFLKISQSQLGDDQNIRLETAPDELALDA